MFTRYVLVDLSILKTIPPNAILVVYEIRAYEERASEIIVMYTTEERHEK